MAPNGRCSGLRQWYSSPRGGYSGRYVPDRPVELKRQKRPKGSGPRALGEQKSGCPSTSEDEAARPGCGRRTGALSWVFGDARLIALPRSSAVSRSTHAWRAFPTPAETDPCCLWLLRLGRFLAFPVICVASSELRRVHTSNPPFLASLVLLRLLLPI